MDGVDEARVARLVAHRQDFAQNGPLRQDEPRFDGVADPHVDGHGFTRQRCFVQGTGSLDDVRRRG